MSEKIYNYDSLVVKVTACAKLIQESFNKLFFIGIYAESIKI